eukprot:3786271-Pyramimonas_sp.AAC.1
MLWSPPEGPHCAKLPPVPQHHPYLYSQERPVGPLCHQVCPLCHWVCPNHNTALGEGPASATQLAHRARGGTLPILSWA